MAQLFADAARAYLSAGINDTDTTISIAAGGSLFPVANGTDWFKAVLQDASGIEIVYVTAHTSASTSFTVTRGQEGTTARSFAAGSVFGIRMTSADMVGFAGKLSDAPSDGKTYGRKDAAWAEVVASGSYQTGDVVTTARALSTPEWLECGKVFLKSSYPDLSTLLGSIPGVEWSFATGTRSDLAPTQASNSAVITDTGAIVAVGHQGGVWRSTDNGTNFIKITGPNTTDVLRSVCVAKNTTGQPDVLVAVGQAGVIWRSTNDGLNWSKITGPNTTDLLTGVAASGAVNGPLVAVGYYGVVWYSSNTGASWIKVSGPNTTDYLYCVIFTIGNTVIALGAVGAYWMSTSAGASGWTRIGASVSGGGQQVVRLNPGVLLAAAPTSRIARSADNGVTWSDVGYTSGNTANCVAVGRLSDTEAFVVQTNGTIRHSIDSGLTWTQVTQPNITTANTALGISSTKAVILGSTFTLQMDGTYYDSATQFITPKFNSDVVGAKRYIKT